MGAIVTVTTTSDEARKALVDVSQDDAIEVQELGQSSGIYMVVFTSASVQVGRGFDTLRQLMDEHAPGCGSGLEKFHFG